MQRTILLGVLILLAASTNMLAQDGRGGSPADRLRALDANKDGKIEPEEIPERFRDFLLKRFEDAGMDTSKPVDVEAYLKAAGGGRSDGERRDNGRRAGERGPNDKAAPLVPGFGETMDLPEVPGFGGEPGTAGAIRARGVPLEDVYHSRIVSYADGILRRYDRNGDKSLDRDEWSRGRWRDPAPEESDANGDGILSREELCVRVSKYDEFAKLSKSSTGKSGSSSSSGTSSSDDGKYDEYARSLVNRYDENKNGELEEKEWRRMSSYHHSADTNGDKIVTRSELADRLASYGRGSSGRSGRSASSPSRDSSDSSPVESYRITGEAKSSRLTPNTERLPKGLPDWFTRNDANADGQISMAEFAVSWSDEKIADFKKHDANSDGIITPAECLVAEPAKPSSRSRYRQR